MAALPPHDGDPGPGLERRVEARRASRIGAHLWVRIGGVDPAARLRPANLSVTGLYIATEEAVGSPGDLVWLSIASQDKARSAQAVARIARVIRQDDRLRGAAVVGAGFEFLPLDRPPAEVVPLVRHAADLTLRGSGAIPIDRESTARLRRPNGALIAARPRVLHRDRVVMATIGRLSPGEEVEVQLDDGTGGVVTLPARAAGCEVDPGADPGATTHLVSLRFEAKGAGAGPSLRGATAVIETLVAPERLGAPPPRLQRVSGQLERVQLSTLLGLVESARLDGIVTLANERTAARIYVSGGRIVDAESDGPPRAPDEVVAELLTWSAGEFTLDPVETRRSRLPGARRPSLIEDLRTLARPAS